MPANIRQHYKAQLERACGNLDTGMGHLLIVKEAYAKDHPEISEQVEFAMLGMLEIQNLVKAIDKTI